MTGIKICFIASDGSKVCLNLPGGSVPQPVHPVTGGGGGKTPSGGTQGSGSAGAGKPGGGSAKPIMRDDLLQDLSLIGSIHTASSSIADPEARAAMMKAAEGAVHKMQEKIQGHGFTIEFDQ